MRWMVDLIYLAAAIVTLPVWLVRMIQTGKIRTDWWGRFGRVPVLPPKSRPRVLIHAVSVGEVNAIRLLVQRLGASIDPAIEVIIATTTDTGFARASRLWSGRHAIVRYPFDFSVAVSRFLDAVQPDLVTLTELEVWPNFTAECSRRGVLVGVVNGRLTERSFRRYRRVGGLIRRSFARLAFVAAQNEEYGGRFRSLGASPQAVQVTGTMKWDTAEIADDVPGASELAEALGIDRAKALIVAGSTALEEHALLHRATPAGVQLLCAPRKPEWFDAAAEALPGCVRRSSGSRSSPTGRFVLDTIGELRQAYALADVVVIGRSFGVLHGSDMMEPVALGKATVIGPRCEDFRETVEALLASDGIVQTTTEALSVVLQNLLASAARRAELAANGRKVIRAHQGATERNAAIIVAHLRARN